MSEQINLINHSSVLIKTVQNINLLTDPWYDESAFNNGWSLLYINRKDEIEKILNNLKFIFISHEHPDHFSIKFFKDYGNLIKENNIKIIFQHTLDKRVENFIKKMMKSILLFLNKVILTQLFCMRRKNFITLILMIVTLLIANYSRSLIL